MSDEDLSLFRIELNNNVVRLVNSNAIEDKICAIAAIGTASVLCCQFAQPR